MITVLWPLLICVAGLVVYFAARTNAKVAEVGRLAYFAGLLVVVYLLAGRAFHV